MTRFVVAVQSRVNSLRSEDGNAAEYGLIIALVAVILIAGATALGVALNTLFSETATELNTP